MVHRGIATIAVALALCFLLLSHFDPQFFLIHFYESLIYVVIVLMLFYFEDRWAYMMGMVAPPIWLILTVVWNGVSAIGREIMAAFQPGDALLCVEPLDDGGDCAVRGDGGWLREPMAARVHRTAKRMEHFSYYICNRCRLLRGDGCLDPAFSTASLTMRDS